MLELVHPGPFVLPEEKSQIHGHHEPGGLSGGIDLCNEAEARCLDAACTGVLNVGRQGDEVLAYRMKCLLDIACLACLLLHTPCFLRAKHIGCQLKDV